MAREEPERRIRSSRAREREREDRRKMKKRGKEEGEKGDDVVPRLHPNYLILPETARNPGYSATVRFQRLNSSSRHGVRERWSQFLALYAAKPRRERWSVGRECRSKKGEESGGG